MNKIILAAMLAACAASGAMAGPLRVAYTTFDFSTPNVNDPTWDSGIEHNSSYSDLGITNLKLNEDINKHILNNPRETSKQLTRYRIETCNTYAKNYSGGHYSNHGRLMHTGTAVCFGTESGKIYNTYSVGKPIDFPHVKRPS